ncbi:uncharacterized protein LOC130806665 [Amaranthus tricolor]|uniref:uncharacterized protein LOC130806665 n=1 Tax=Amaranthus tricolor TaxID=29722 RepID=UPI0025830A47|nr:uncharacterized protein LOC130806665 [Amaranthus tricolor]
MAMATQSPFLFNPTSKPISFFTPSNLNLKTYLPTITCNASIKPPPPEFDFRSSQISSLSRSTISEIYPELLDLADMGCLVLVQKHQFGPVPAWRSEFVEPDEIWLVGTTHIDQASSLHVDRVVRTLQPDNVVVELCRSRAGIMYTSSSSQPGNQLSSSMFSLSGAEFFGAVGRSINLGGQTALALRLLLAVFSSKISSDVDRPFGDEFRVARIVSEEIGAQIVLGDRPIEITLERAWDSLKWAERISLVGSVIRGITSTSAASRDNVKELGTDDNPYQLYEKLSSAYPSLVQPLILERDTYLAWSLKRSKAVNNCKRVVGVIGKGHLNGVIYALVSDLGDLRFRDLAGKRAGADIPNAWIGKVLKDLARDTLIGIILWALYEQLKSSF